MKTTAAVCSGEENENVSWKSEALMLNVQTLEGAIELYSVRSVTICSLGSRNGTAT